MATTITSRDAAPNAQVRREIAGELAAFLRTTRLSHLFVAEADHEPPVLAYVTPFPRLTIPLAGQHAMEVAGRKATRTIRPVCGDAVFVPAHAWNRPTWRTSTTALTLLFGAKQVGVSLVRHSGGAREMRTIKTSVQRSSNGMLSQILLALTAATADHGSRWAPDAARQPLPRLLTESLLHACLALLAAPATSEVRKSERTYETICLYVQEHYHEPILRETVARHLGLAPSYISRLFRHYGLMRFTDYLNFVRINRAKFLLRTYGMPLKEIAVRCGYSEVSYFCIVFKRLTTLTPTQYRHAAPRKPAGRRTLT